MVNNKGEMDFQIKYIFILVLYSTLTWQHMANCVRAETRAAAGDAERLHQWNGANLESTEFVLILQMKAAQ